MATMKRRCIWTVGLTLRMLVTTGLLGLYVVFAVVLFSLFNVGLVPMLLIVVGIAVFQYYTSDKLALRAAGAKVVTREEAPRPHDMVSCAAAPPTSRSRRSRSWTRRPLAEARRRVRDDRPVAHLEPKEEGVKGVLAHELSHVANRDIMTVASFFAMLAALLTRFGLYAGMWWRPARATTARRFWLIVLVVSAVVYGIGYILIRTISRYREYCADRGSLSSPARPRPDGASEKISSQMTLINAFFIVPAKVKSATAKLFMDHPPLEKRIEALAKIAREMGRPVA